MFHRVAKTKGCLHSEPPTKEQLGGCQVLVSGEKRTANWKAFIDALQSKQGYRIVTIIFSGAVLNHNCARSKSLGHVWRKGLFGLR